MSLGIRTILFNQKGPCGIIKVCRSPILRHHPRLLAEVTPAAEISTFEICISYPDAGHASISEISFLQAGAGEVCIVKDGLLKVRAIEDAPFRIAASNRVPRSCASAKVTSSRLASRKSIPERSSREKLAL